MPLPVLQILVCANDRGAEAPRPSCAQRGSLQLYQHLKSRVKELGLRDEVLVTRTGCQRRCSFGITVVAWPGNRWHGGVTLDDVEPLLEALRHGEVFGPRSMPDGPWE